MDARFTGHHYELVSALDTWTKQQPRKGLWERNSRFYIPQFHGNYSTFDSYIQSRYSPLARNATIDNRNNNGTIWGPYPPFDQRTMPWDDEPPTEDPSPDWGIGEDADLITLLPMFSPGPTHYVGKHTFQNYPSVDAGNEAPPRRTTIITFYRLSSRLLNMMHLENTRDMGHHMGSESWAQTVALHHGLKAVYAPHSVFMDREWPAQALEFIFNNGDNAKMLDIYQYLERPGEGSGGTESVFGLGREHNFFETASWYYRAKLAGRVYKRWLGIEADGLGGYDVSATTIFCPCPFQTNTILPPVGITARHLLPPAHATPPHQSNRRPTGRTSA